MVVTKALPEVHSGVGRKPCGQGQTVRIYCGEAKRVPFPGWKQCGVTLVARGHTFSLSYSPEASQVLFLKRRVVHRVRQGFAPNPKDAGL